MFDGLWQRPVLAAPMAGGPSTPDLVVAVAEAGGLGFVATGYRSADDVSAELGIIAERTSRPFGVNLFVPGRASGDRAAIEAYAAGIAPEAARLGAELGDARWEDDAYDAKLEVVMSAAPAVCSFTFGCPERRVVDAMRRRGIVVVVTVTSADEAAAAAGAGADAVVAQGIEAGAHRGTFDDTGADEALPTLDLVAAIGQRSSVPILAAGGITDADDVRRALDAGAIAAQVGTAFLLADEAGTNPVHRAALVDPAFTTTELTRAFTGRRARGLVNRFMTEHPDAPTAYPEIHHLTRPFRMAAVAQGDPSAASLWAGTGFRSAAAGPAAEILDRLTP